MPWFFFATSYTFWHDILSSVFSVTTRTNHRLVHTGNPRMSTFWILTLISWEGFCIALSEFCLYTIYCSFMFQFLSHVYAPIFIIIIKPYDAFTILPINIYVNIFHVIHSCIASHHDNEIGLCHIRQTLSHMRF